MRPLEDIRVIAIEQFGAGPFATLQLVAMGAEVIKIEDPQAGGDVGRYVPPFASGTDSLFFETFNRGKRSIALDLGTVDGRGVFEQLVAVSDVVFSNLRGDVPAKLRIRYDDLKHLNPAIVCCSLSGYGMNGPRAAQPGYDYVLQALAGWMSLTGEPDGPPAKSGLSLVDYSAGLVATVSILGGIHRARRDGVGLDCDVSLFDTALSMLTYPGTWYLSRGLVPQRTHSSAHPSLIPFQAFEASDGWLVVACPKEKFWVRLADVLEVPGLGTDPRFSDFARRRENADVLSPVLEAAFRTRTVGDWVRMLTAVGVPCGPVNDVAAALADPQVEARGLVAELDHPRLGPYRFVRSPVRVGDEVVVERPAPELGADWEYVAQHILGHPRSGEAIAGG